MTYQEQFDTYMATATDEQKHLIRGILIDHGKTWKEMQAYIESGELSWLP